MLPRDLNEYRGIEPGDKRKLTKKANFGSHWKNHLADTYLIKGIWESPRYREDGQDNPDAVLTEVESIEDPEFGGIISINRFL